MRIAAIMPDTSVNAAYRVRMPMEELGRRGHSVSTFAMSDLRNARGLLNYDVVYAWRLHGNDFLRTARMLSDSSVGLVWDNDDDVRAIDVRGRAGAKYFSGLNGHRVFGLMVTLMRCADIVTTPSRALAAIYREASGADVRVVENYVRSIQAIPRARRVGKSDPVVIGWVANVEHQTDIERLRLREPMQRLLDAHPNVTIVSIGCGLGLKGDRYRHIKWVPYAELSQHVAQLDIGIAPIADTPFNRARSNIKAKEYAAVSVPWLASPIGPYAELGEKQGGRLVQDDQWYDALHELVLDPKARRRLSRRAAAWGETQTLEANGHLWESTLADAVAASVGENQR